MTAPVYNPPVPYVGHIDGGVYPGRLVRIQGVPLPTATRFSINLQCGPNTNPRDDIALHLSALFNENAVTRNSLINQTWGQDERHGHFPFVPGQSFEIILLCDPAHYKIAINGQHYTEFAHRIQYQRATHLTIDGDVTLTLIQFEGSSSVPGMAGTAATMGLTAGAGYGVGAMTAPSYQPYPAGGVPPYPMSPSGGMPPYPAQPYPAAPGYPVQAGYQTHGQGQPPYPGYNAQSPSNPYHHGSGGGILDKAGAAIAGVLGGAGVASVLGHGKHKKKGYQQSFIPGGAMGTALGAGAMGAAMHGKKNKSAAKKAMKYGVPIAGLGLGAYGISKMAKHGFHGGSSSSSSSSSEEE